VSWQTASIANCWIAFGAGFLSCARAQPTTVRVFADVNHRGALAGPLPAAPANADEFAIVASLPAKAAVRVLSPDVAAPDSALIARLARVRVEGLTTGQQIDLSIRGAPVAAIRLYVKAGDGWRLMPPGADGNWTVSADVAGTIELGLGVVFPEAARGSAEPAWPRAFSAAIEPRGAASKRTVVSFRVAPYIVPSTLEPVDELLVIAEPATAGVVEILRVVAARAKIKFSPIKPRHACAPWMQDTMQPGVFIFPTHDKTEQIQASLLAVRKELPTPAASLDRQVAELMRVRGVVTVKAGVPRKHFRWIDGYGNLEATPPFTDRSGRLHPYGRLITGRRRESVLDAGVLRFLEAQEIQWPPVVVDVSWLLVGHVDEVVNFVPARNKPGFKVLLPSPSTARTLLASLSQSRMAAEPVFEDTPSETTVGELLAHVAGSDENQAIERAVTQIRDQLKRELNLDDADFIMLPALFDGGAPVIPNPVNSTVINGHLLVSEPRGPRQDGTDVFERAIRKALMGCALDVIFIDAWEPYHMAGGEVHCATNAFRHFREPEWWKYTRLRDESASP
jgi:hypothetical protein